MPFDDDGSWAPRPLRVGVTGHRWFGGDAVARIQRSCRQLLTSLRSTGHLDGAGVEAYSCLAVGADTLFAEAALELDIPLVGVLPFANYHRDFDGPELETFRSLLDRCTRVIRLDRTRKTNRAYLAAGTALVRQIDVLLAVWDGAPAHGKGGTGDVVTLAERRGLRVIRVAVDRPELPSS